MPLGNGPLLREAGIGNVEELDWGARRRVGQLDVVCVPAQHWSGRGLRERMGLAPDEPIPPRYWWLKRITVGVALLLMTLAGLRWWPHSLARRARLLRRSGVRPPLHAHARKVYFLSFFPVILQGEERR